MAASMPALGLDLPLDIRLNIACETHDYCVSLPEILCSGRLGNVTDEGQRIYSSPKLSTCMLYTAAVATPSLK